MVSGMSGRNPAVTIEALRPAASWLDGQDVERRNRYREYLGFYQGEQWTGRRRAGETRLTFNYARTLTRKTVSYLMPKPVTFNVLADGDDNPEHARRAEALLSRVYAENDQHTSDIQSALDASVLGDGAFKVTWSERLARPVIAAVDPQGLWAWWRPDNPGEVYRVVQRYEISPEESEVLFGARPAGAGSPTGRLTVVEEWWADRYRIDLAGETVREGANPYNWIPYLIYPNLARPHEFWGASDLEDLIDVCRELNRRMTTISRVLEVAGYPITVLENVTGSEGIRAEAGAVWELPEASRAYLLDMLQGGGVNLHIEYVQLLYRQLHDLSETPRTAFGDSGRSISGVALEVEIQPLVQKVMRKRRVWYAIYRRRNAMVLDLLERFGGAELGGLRRTATIWGEVLPSDRDALARTESRLVASSIHSHQTAMANLGDDDPDGSWLQILDELRALGEFAGGGGKNNGTHRPA
jgi:hypothetical protein